MIFTISKLEQLIATKVNALMMIVFLYFEYIFLALKHSRTFY